MEDRKIPTVKKLITAKEAAEYLSVGETTMRKMMHEPNCPYVCKFGQRLFVNTTVLNKYIDSITGR